MSKESSKEIVVLSEREHILLRPTVYVGSVKSTDEKVPLVRQGKIVYEEKPISVGMYKILNEVIDNSVDEAKRMKGKMKTITISINSKSNSATVKDTGNGFYKGTSVNKDSGKTNIETAVSMLRAGSNFNNEEIEEALIGMNGMGVALTNVLSRRFKIVTVNETHYFEKEWIDFQSDDSKTIIKKHKGDVEKGTSITFEPLVETFGKAKWDQEILKSSIMFKKRLISRDPILKNLNIEFYWDDKLVDTDGEFFPKNSFSLETPIGEVVIWEEYESSGSISFVNSAMCTGMHQRLVNEFINEKLDDSLGHHFYDTFIALNLPPKFVKFGDQNKTRFVTPREEITPPVKSGILSKLDKFFKTDLYKRIQKKVEERRTEGEVKKLKAEKKKVNVKHSHKYFPPTSRTAESLFIVEGLCIDENEKINIWREGELIHLPLKDVLIGDEVITHQNRIRKILNKQKKLKECVTIKLKDGTILKQPKSHRYYVYDKINSSFTFKKVEEIDIKSDCLVKSNLSSFIGTIEVIDFIKCDNEKYPNQIFLEDGSWYQFSNDHKYCIYDKDSLTFRMEFGKNIKIGDLICSFDSI